MQALTRTEMPAETPEPGAAQLYCKWQRHPLAIPARVLCKQGMPTSGSNVRTVEHQSGRVLVGRIIMRRGDTVLGEPAALAVREDDAVVARRAAAHSLSLLEESLRTLRNLVCANGVLTSSEDMHTGAWLTCSIHVCHLVILHGHVAVTGEAVGLPCQITAQSRHGSPRLRAAS